jgi:hypothetical protein
MAHRPKEHFDEHAPHIGQEEKSSGPTQVVTDRTTHGELEARTMKKIGALYNEINQ